MTTNLINNRIVLDTNVLLQKRLKDLGRVSLQNRDAMYDDELFNKLFPYETMISNSIKPARRYNDILQSSSSRNLNSPDSLVKSNKVKDPSDVNESIVREIEASVVKKDGQDEVLIDLPSEKPVVSPSIEKQSPGKDAIERPTLSKSSIDLNKAKSVAFNSREVRLMGPEMKEVEMKDDLATKVAVVFDNLRSETSQFLGEVNEKLDKGWTEFKQSVDKLVEQGKKEIANYH